MREDPAEMKQEWGQIESYIQDNIDHKRVYIKSGLLEPVHLMQKEREILVNGMKETMEKSINEIESAMLTYYERTKHPSAALAEQKKNIQELAKSFLV